MSRKFTSVQLLRFQSGNRVFRYAQSAVTIHSFDAGFLRAYEGSVIKIGALKSRTKLSDSDSLNIKLPRSLPVADLIIAKELTSGIEFELTQASIDLDGNVTLLPQKYLGSIVSFTYSNSIINIEISGVSERLQGLGLRRKFSTTCQHALYDNQCLVSKQDFSVNLNLTYQHGRTAVGGGYIVLFGLPMADSLYDNGVAIMELDSVEITLRIAHNDTDTIFVDYLPNNLPVSPAPLGNIVIRQGCDLTFDTCQNTFFNDERFGGFPYFIDAASAFDNDQFNPDNVQDLSVQDLVDRGINPPVITKDGLTFP